MSYFSNLNEQPIAKASVFIPFNGVWFADITMTEIIDLSGFGKLTIEDLVLQGTIFNLGQANLRSYYRLIGGKNSWGKILKPKHYHADNGVKIKEIINQAAQEVGELIDSITIPVDKLEAVDFVRMSQPASTLLNQILSNPSRWWVNYNGLTVIGERKLEIDIDQEYQVIHMNPIIKVAEIKTTTPSIIQIGSKIKDPNTNFEFIVKNINIEMDSKTFKIMAKA